MKIYSKPKSNQFNEKLFQKYILERLNNYKHIDQTYVLTDVEFQYPLIDIRKIEDLVILCNHLKVSKKNKLLGVLNSLPDSVRVAERSTLISVDFLIVNSKNKKHYIEFHETQHRKLTNNRSTTIFDKDYNCIKIPRYVQRFLKDIWRFENLPNYKIIWLDWFESNPNFSIKSLLKSKAREFQVENLFSFSRLLKQSTT